MPDKTLRWGVWRQGNHRGVTATCWSCGLYHVALDGERQGRYDVTGRKLPPDELIAVINGYCPLCKGQFGGEARCNRAHAEEIASSRTVNMERATEVLFVGPGAVVLAETEGVMLPLMGGRTELTGEVWPGHKVPVLPGEMICRTLAKLEVP